MRGQVMLRSALWRRRAELLLCPFLGCVFCCFPTAQIHAQQATPAPAQSQQPAPEAPAAKSTAGQTQQPAPEAPAAKSTAGQTQQPGPEAPATNSTADQTQLPQIVVSGDKPKATAKPKRNVNASAPKPVAQDAPTPAQAALNAEMTKMNQARDNILPKIGATTYTFTREAIVSMPQGDNTPIDKLILQFPGVSYDSAASNPNFHVRNEYANVQTRINGVVIPEGVSGLGALIDTNFIARISLLTGTLPAQYGLRTAGVLDIITRSYATPN